MSVKITGNPLSFEAEISKSKFNQDIKAIEKSIDGLKSKQEAASKALITSQNSADIKKYSKKIKDAENNIKLLEAEINRLKNSGGSGFDSLGKSVNSFRGYLKSAASDALGFATGMLSAGTALKYVFDKTLELGSIRTSLGFILGSEGQADSKLSDLKESARLLGVEYLTLAESYKSFIGAAKASNFDLTQSEKIFNSVSKAAAVLGLSDEQLKGSLLAIQQMISKGNVQAEELRGQLSERLPGAFSLAAKAMGVTERELNKLLETGQVVASDLLPKLADQLDKAFGDKATEGITGLRSEMGRLQTELQAFAGESSSLSKNIFEPIVIGARSVINDLSQLTRGSFMENLRYFFTLSSTSLKNQQNVYNLRDRNKAAASTLDGSVKNDYSTKTLGELRSYYTQIDKSYNDAAINYNEFLKGVKSGNLKEEFKGQLDQVKSVATALLFERKRIGASIDEAKKTQIVGNKEIADTALTSIDQIRKRIEALQKLSGSATNGSDVFKRIEALKARLSTKSFKGEDQDSKTILNEQESLEKRIQSLKDKYTRKSLDKDSEARLAITDEFKKLAYDIELQAKKYDAYAKKYGTEKATNLLGTRKDVSTLEPIRQKAIIDLTYRQDTEKLKISLLEQRALYESYEEFRTQFGKAKADERFKNELNIAKTYGQKLNEEIQKTQKSVDANNLDGAASERLKNLQKFSDENVTYDRKKNQELLAEFQTFTDKRFALQEAFEVKINELSTTGKKAEAEIARQKAQDSILELGRNHVTQLASYKQFFEDVEDLSSAELNNRFEKLKKELQAIDNPELKEFIERILKVGQQQVNTKTLEGYKIIASSLQEAAQASSGLSEGLSEGLSIAGNLATSMISIKENYDKFKEAGKKGDVLGQFGAATGGISAIMGIASFVTGLFDKARQFREENKKVIDDFNNKRYFAEFDINALYRERLRTQLELNAATLTGLKNNTTELKKQLQENAADYVRIAALLSGESYVTGYKNQSGANLQVTQVPVLESLAGKSYSDIEKLFLSGVLTDKAKQLFEQLQKLKNEGVDIDKLLSDNKKSIMEAATGTTADSIRDSIILGFRNGYRTAADFAHDFKDLMNKANRQIFKEFIDNQELKAFYEQYASLAKDGALTDAQKAQLKVMYDAMIGRISTKYDDLKGITGEDFLNDKATTSSKNSLSGAYAAASQDSINILAGYTAAVKLELLKVNAFLAPMGATMLQQLQVATDNLTEIRKIQNNTLRTADNSELLKDMKISLSVIASGSNSAYNPLIAGSGAKLP